MNQLMTYTLTSINKLYKWVVSKIKKKRTHFTLEVPLELDDSQDYNNIIVQTIKLMEQNINIKNK